MENQNYTSPAPLISGGGDGKNVAADEKHDLEDNKDSTLNRENVEDEEENFGEKSKMAYSETDPTKVKFTNMVNHGSTVIDGKNNEAKVDIENVQLSFAGMGKEELMKYADDPFWVRLRWILFIFFWIIWAFMLAGAIIIVVMTPGCPPPPTREWFHKGVIYQVYPRSFKDSNGDGIGDIKGVIEKLDYIADLGVNAIWLNPIFTSPMKDGGYDVSNYVDIAPVYGTLDDFKTLLEGAKNRSLRVILDFIPNHSSDQHPWFTYSRNRTGNYTDYYIWRNSKLPREVPNNWVSVFGGPAWAYDAMRDQYYYHQFLQSQPDLNLRNPLVREELKQILRFWLDLGVDGFRVDAFKHLFEVEDIPNEPTANGSHYLPESYESLNHMYTTGLPENLELLHEWREILDSYKAEDGKHRLLVVEVYDDIDNVMTYYGNDSFRLADFPFNFQLTNLTVNDGAKEVFKAVNSWLNGKISESRWPNWVLGNHDVNRLASRVGESLVDAYNMIVMLIGGTPFTYYGEEIGMTNGHVSYEEQQDPLGKSHSMNYLKYTRDLERTPMQWNNASHAGFTQVKPWLPVADNYMRINVEAEESDSNSHLKIYKKLVGLRKEPAIIYGELHFLVNNENIFSFARVKKGSPGFAVLINFSDNKTTVDLANSKCCEKNFKFPDDGTVELKSTPLSSDYSVAKSGSKLKVHLNEIAMEPKESLLVKFVPSFS